VLDFEWKKFSYPATGFIECEDEGFVLFVPGRLRQFSYFLFFQDFLRILPVLLLPSSLNPVHFVRKVSFAFVVVGENGVEFSYANPVVSLGGWFPIIVLLDLNYQVFYVFSTGICESLFEEFCQPFELEQVFPDSAIVEVFRVTPFNEFLQDVVVFLVN
jgi:hypothetical protein